MADVSDVLGFVWNTGVGSRVLFVLGSFCGVCNGLVYPILAWLFSTSFSDISAAGSDGLGRIRKLAYTFMIVGVYALVMACLQTGCFEICSHRATKSFRLQWFQSLLRQDAAFFDVHDIGGRYRLHISCRYTSLNIRNILTNMLSCLVLRMKVWLLPLGPTLVASDAVQDENLAKVFSSLPQVWAASPMRFILAGKWRLSFSPFYP